MPLYTVVTQSNTLADPDKARLAAELTNLHAHYANVPTNWVHVVFQDYEAGSGFSDGVPSPTAILTVGIRTGRSADYKQELLMQLWRLLQVATNLPDTELIVALQEVDATNIMEMGKVMPSVAS